MEDLRKFGEEIKGYEEALGEDFIDCGSFVDIIYELLREYKLQSPRPKDFIYSGDQVNDLLQLIVDNKQLSDLDLGKLVVANL